MFCSKQLMIGTSKNIWGFDPRTIPGCVVWLDAADTSTLTLSGSNITAWRDKSTFSNNVNSISTTAPTYDSTDSSVNFVATSGTFLRGTMSATYSNSVSVFVVASIATQTSPAYPRLSMIGLSSTANSILIGQQLYVNGGNTSVITYLSTGTNPSGQGTNIMTLISNVTYSTRQVITNISSYIGTAYTISTFLNGDSQTTSTSTRSGTFTASGTNVATYNKYSLANYPDAISTGGDSYSGKIFEYLVFNSALTTAQRQGVEGYLTWKWRLVGYSPITPLSLGCQLWLDASDSSTITLSGSSVTQWNDKSGNGNNMIPWTTFSNATVSINSQTNLNVLNFSATGVYQGTISNGPYPADVYLVMALKDTTTHVDVISVYSSNTGSTFNSLTFGEYTASRWHNGSDGFARTPNVVSPSNETSTSFLLMNWSISNNNYIIRRNGTQLIQSASYTYTRPADSRFQIGFRVNPTVFSPATTAGPFRGYIGEIVAFNTQLGDAQRQQIENYLGLKWGLTGLPLSHPYYSLKPHLQYFQPDSISGCQLWFDGADYNTMFQDSAGITKVTAASQSVACWNDKIRGLGISNTGVLGQTMLAPTSVSGGGVFFSNTSSTVSATARGLGTSLTGATNQTAFLFRMPAKYMTMVTVSLPLSNDSLRQICGVGSYPVGTAAPNFFMGPEMGAGNGGTMTYDFNGTAHAQVATSTTGYNSNTVLRIDVLSSDVTPLWVTNGTSNTFTTTNNYTTANSNYPVNYVVMGGYSSTLVGSRNFNGTVYEMLLYSRSLTVTERQQIEGYLAWKWGLIASIPTGHPYKTIPTALTVPPVVDPLPNGGGGDSVIVKYNSSGIPFWARRLGGAGSERTNSVSTDSSGNIIVTGDYVNNPMNIYAADGTTVSFTLAVAGNYDSFIVKYNSSGTPLWVRRLAGTLGDISKSVSIDSSGNIIVTGTYLSSPLNIYAVDGTTVSSTLTNSGTTNSFLVKYNSSGTLLWNRKIGGTLNDDCRSVTTDLSRNIIVVGVYTSDPLNIFGSDGTTPFFTLVKIGSITCLVVKYNSSGTPLWARRIGGSLNAVANRVITDSSENIIVVGGYTSDPLNIYAADGTTVSFTLPNSGDNDGLIVKYDSNGTLLWARRIGGTGSDSIISGSIDSSGNIIVTGLYSASPLNIFAADGTTVSFTLTSSGTFDTYLVKYDSNGTLLWARRMGGGNRVDPFSVSTDLSGNIILVGTFNLSPMNFYSADGTTVSFTLNNKSSVNTFIVKYNSSGTPLWGKILGVGNDSLGRSVTTDSSENIIVTGVYNGNPQSFYG